MPAGATPESQPSQVAADKPATGAPMMIGRLKVAPITLGTFWLLQDLDSPLLPDKDAPIGIKDLAAAVFALTKPEEASEAFRKGRDEFDKLARTAAQDVPLIDLNSLGAILTNSLPPA